MYLKKYDQLSADQISNIENDICKSGTNFKDLSLKHGVFENVIVKIAKGIGIDLDSNDEDTFGDTRDEMPEKKQHKKYTILTEDQKSLIKKEYEKNKTERGIKSRLAEKFNVSFNSITRAIEGDHRYEKKDATNEQPEVKPTLPTTATVVKKEEAEEKPKDTLKSYDTVSNIVLLSKYVSVKTLQVRLDPTNTGYSTPIFEKDLGSYKATFDFESVVKVWFEKNVKDQKVNNLEVLYKVSGHDVKVTALLVKYCMKYQVNLTFVLPGGIRRDPIITDFCEESLNLQRIISTSQEAAKYVYKTPFTILQLATEVYTLHMVYVGSKAIYVADSSSKIYELMADLCQKHADSAFKILVYKMRDGQQEQTIELKSVNWIENK